VSGIREFYCASLFAISRFPLSLRNTTPSKHFLSVIFLVVYSTNIPLPPYLAYAGVNAATAAAAVVQVVKTLAFALKPVPARAHTTRLVLLALLLLLLLLLLLVVL
jgi:hypothetical protein